MILNTDGAPWNLNSTCIFRSNLSFNLTQSPDATEGKPGEEKSSLTVGSLRAAQISGPLYMSLPKEFVLTTNIIHN